MKLQINLRNVVVALVAAGLMLLPLYSQLSGNIFVLTLFTRIVIFALAAASLNLIMGYGGMMSFGHAAYLGIGALRAGDRRVVFTHPRRLLHHDHARLCPDGLLHRLGDVALWR